MANTTWLTLQQSSTLPGTQWTGGQADNDGNGTRWVHSFIEQSEGCKIRQKEKTKRNMQETKIEDAEDFRHFTNCYN